MSGGRSLPLPLPLPPLPTTLVLFKRKAVLQPIVGLLRPSEWTFKPSLARGSYEALQNL
jgi:hypothetical protein